MNEYEAAVLGGGFVAGLVLVMGKIDGSVGLAVLLAALVCSMLVVIGLVRREFRSEAVQPVVQPLARPAATVEGLSVEPTHDVLVRPPVVNDYRRQQPSPPVAMGDATAPQPAVRVSATAPQPVARASATAPQPVGMVEALGVLGAAQWYQDQALGSAPWDALSVISPETAVAAVARPLLPRRSPTVTDYKLIAEVLAGSRSQNEAIRILWGAKDGKTLAWLARVRDLYVQEQHISRADIIAWELELTGDDVVDVAERLGVSVEEVEVVLNG